MNQITITLDADANATIIERAHAAIDAFAGHFVAATLQNAGTTSGYVAPAASQTIEQVAGNQAAPELDATGLPWDERIHASTKTKTQKGEWTKRKGVDEAVAARVVAELRAIYPAPQVAPVTPAATGGVPNIAPAAGVSVPAVRIAPKSEYQKLVDFIATNVGAGKLGQDVVDATFAQYNTSLAAMAADEESSKAFREAFESAVAA